MREQETKGIKASIILIAIVLVYSAVNVIGKGVLSWHIVQKEYRLMMAEVCFLWLALFLI